MRKENNSDATHGDIPWERFELVIDEQSKIIDGLKEGWCQIIASEPPETSRNDSVWPMLRKRAKRPTALTNPVLKEGGKGENESTNYY